MFEQNRTSFADTQFLLVLRYFIRYERAASSSQRRVNSIHRTHTHTKRAIRHHTRRQPRRQRHHRSLFIRLVKSSVRLVLLGESVIECVLFPFLCLFSLHISLFLFFYVSFILGTFLRIYLTLLQLRFTLFSISSVRFLVWSLLTMIVVILLCFCLSFIHVCVCVYVSASVPFSFVNEYIS